MTESAEPRPEPTTGAAATQADVDLPRLPEAAPAATPPPEPTPDPHAAAAVELDESAPAKQSKAPVGFFVFMLLIVGAIAAIAAVARPWESAEGATSATTATIEEAPTASAAPATTAPATTTPATTAPATVPATSVPATSVPATSVSATGTEIAPTTTLVVAPLTPTVTADAGPFEVNAEACQVEQRTVSVAVEAYDVLNGALPANADELVTAELLRPRPDGWSTRWAFAKTDSGIAVVPVAGGACDL